MATRTWALGAIYPGLSQKVTCAGLLNGDVSNPIRFPHFAQKTFTVAGTWGVGGNVVCEGSNDGGANWYALSDLANASLATITANGIKDLRGNPELIRFRVSAGDGTTNLQVDVVMTAPGQITA